MQYPYTIYFRGPLPYRTKPSYNGLMPTPNKLKRPTQAAIDKEIATLVEMKPKVRKFSAFGDNHHEAIDAQLEVIRQEVQEEDFDDSYEDDADHVRDAAQRALDWMQGITEETPSDEWKDLIQEPAAVEPPTEKKKKKK